ncbi:MAG: hemolysin-type calcium-binding repeat family protein [Rhizobium sp.]|nr:hemolysin-type calcium-binding repeat family protein [Rhizobium sp.]
MARYNGNYDDGFLFDRPREVIEFTSRSKVYDRQLAISVTPDATGSKLAIAGNVSSDAYGIVSWAGEAEIMIKSRGVVDAETGVQLGGTDQWLFNYGSITSDLYGVVVEGSATDVVNEGRISASIGVSVLGDVNLVNGSHGRIVAQDAGVLVAGSASSSAQLLNRGSIVCDKYAVIGGSSNDIVTNRGRIVGDIDLGGGQDLFDGRRGTVTGTVKGNDGDDRYVIDDARIGIMEYHDGGADVVVTSVNYHLPANLENLFLSGRKNLVGHGNDDDNAVAGNKGDNVLFGHEGVNILLGFGGNDRLVGGSQQDTFVFASGYGRDTIENFQDGVDLITATYWYEFEDLADMLDHARDVKGDVVISHGRDRLIIENISTTQLDATDFTS